MTDKTFHEVHVMYEDNSSKHFMTRAEDALEATGEIAMRPNARINANGKKAVVVNAFVSNTEAVQS